MSDNQQMKLFVSALSFLANVGSEWTRLSSLEARGRKGFTGENDCQGVSATEHLLCKSKMDIRGEGSSQQWLQLAT